MTDELTGQPRALLGAPQLGDRLGPALPPPDRADHARLDDFKTVNVNYGREQGDAVLRHVARVLRENSRDADSSARYGGEELSLILPHTDLDGADGIAARIRATVEGLRITRTGGRGVLRITASPSVTGSTAGERRR